MQQSAAHSSGRGSRGPRALADCGSFATLAKRAARLDALDRALRQTLPLPLRNYVRFADLHRGRLVFLAATPVWAARLRLAQRDILAAAGAIGVKASAVVAKVAVVDQETPAPLPKRHLPPALAAHLRASAAACHDEAQRAIYLALADVAAAGAQPAKPR